MTLDELNSIDLNISSAASAVALAVDVIDIATAAINQTGPNAPSINNTFSRTQFLLMTFLNQMEADPNSLASLPDFFTE